MQKIKLKIKKSHPIPSMHVHISSFPYVDFLVHTHSFFFFSIYVHSHPPIPFFNFVSIAVHFLLQVREDLFVFFIYEFESLLYKGNLFNIL